MSKKTWAIVAVVLAAVLALGFSIPALAEEPDEVGALSGPGFMVRGRFWVGSWDLFDTIADLFGLDPTELFEKLHEGQTIEEIAEELGVDTQEIQAGNARGKARRWHAGAHRGGRRRRHHGRGSSRMAPRGLGQRLSRRCRAFCHSRHARDDAQPHPSLLRRIAPR